MREAWLVLLGVLLTIWQCFNREIFTLPHNGGACWQTRSHMGSDKPVPCCWLLLFVLTPLWYRIKIAKPKPGPARFVLSSRRCRLLPVASGNTRRPRPGPGPGPGPDPSPGGSAGGRPGNAASERAARGAAPPVLSCAKLTAGSPATFLSPGFHFCGPFFHRPSSSSSSSWSEHSAPLSAPVSGGSLGALPLPAPHFLAERWERACPSVEYRRRRSLNHAQKGARGWL